MSDGSRVQVPSPTIAGQRTVEARPSTEPTGRGPEPGAPGSRPWSPSSPPDPALIPQGSSQGQPRGSLRSRIPAGHDLSRVRIHPGAPRQIMPRLVMGQTHDRYEEEAVRVANLAVHGGAPPPAHNLSADQAAPLRRRPLEGEDEERPVQTWALPGHAPQAPPGLEAD